MGNVTRASRWQLVNVDEDSFLRIARIEGKHPLINVLLQTLAVIARSQSAASGTREQARFDALSLSVSGPGDFLDDDAPFSIGVHGSEWASIQNVTWADVTFTTDPVSLLERLSVVLGVIEMFLRQGSQSIDQVVGRLVGNVGVLLQHQQVIIDGILNIK